MSLKHLIISIAISNGIGILSGVLTSNSFKIYNKLILPPLAPPDIAFPIVWTILFILMGISSYLIYQRNTSLTKKALAIYAIQLFVNFIWPLIFFTLKFYWFAFIWLIFLFSLIIVMINLFYRIKPLAAFIQLPYLLWIIFAGYLNLMIAILND